MNIGTFSEWHLRARGGLRVPAFSWLCIRRRARGLKGERGVYRFGLSCFAHAWESISASDGVLRRGFLFVLML